MSFLKGLIDNFSSKSSVSDPSDDPRSNPSYNSSSSTVEAAPSGNLVSNERVAYKLRGYFDLAKEEIAKAVRAEEWGLMEDAIMHYRNAQRILVEASSTPVPSYISPRYLVVF